MSEIGTAMPGPAPARRLASAGFWLGFGLGGFFDGILLHQILQWHHLLSGVAPDDTLASLRFQVLADGLFHALTFALTILGLWLLWSARAAVPAPGAGRSLAAAGLLGFGLWHIVDALAFHWTLGLHRIRMGTESPLLWDILWLVPFGLAPAALGAWLFRRQPPADGAPPAGGRPAALVLALGALVAGPLAMLPPPGQAPDRILAIFRAGMDFPAIVTAAEAAGGRPIWSDAAGGVWLIALEPGARASALYRHGALLVSNGPVSLGCLSWSEADA